MDWKDFYPDAEEAIPLNAPDPKGNPVKVELAVELAKFFYWVMCHKSLDTTVLFFVHSDFWFLRGLYDRMHFRR